MSTSFPSPPVTASSIKVGTTSDTASAIVDIVSTTKGMLPPRMTTAQKNAITSPATALVVYDSDLISKQIYKTFSVTGKQQNSNTNDVTFTSTALYQTLNTGMTEVVCLVSLNNATNWTALVSGAVTLAIIGNARSIYNNDFASSTVGKGLNYASPTTLSVGVYKLVLGLMNSTDRAIMDISVKINGSGTYTLLSTYDCYSTLANALNQMLLEKYFTVTTAGSFDISFTANGKNASSSSYGILLAGFMLYKLG